jgi:putative heme-binding domain-containing protein
LVWAGCVLSAQEHAGQYSQADIERGFRIYGANCSPCHGVDGDQVSNVNLRSGKFRRAASDEDLARLIAAGVPGTAMPPHKFDSGELTGIVAFLRSMGAGSAAGIAIGDAARGRSLFDGKAACASCHRVRGEGSRFAPDLSDIGAARPVWVLQKSLVDPSGAMLPMNRPVRAVTRDGRTIAGRRLNEDTYSVQLIDREDRLVSLMKADLREYTVEKLSPMPSYREKLSGPELADVLAYLLTLKGGN